MSVIRLRVAFVMGWCRPNRKITVQARSPAASQLANQHHGLDGCGATTAARRSLRGQACLRMWQSVGLLLFKRLIFNPLTQRPLTPTTSWDQTPLDQCGCPHGKLIFSLLNGQEFSSRVKFPVLKKKYCNILKSDFNLFTRWQEKEAKTIKKKLELKMKSNS